MPKGYKHGFHGTRLYRIWTAMKYRCDNPNNDSYKWYGARGIQVCNEWKNNFMNFYNWSMEHGYKENLTIDRINVNSDYKPSNCRWVNMKVQMRNSRRNNLITINGETKTLVEWCEIYNITYRNVWIRIKNGLDIENAITKPVRKYKKKVEEN